MAKNNPTTINVNI